MSSSPGACAWLPPSRSINQQDGAADFDLGACTVEIKIVCAAAAPFNSRSSFGSKVMRPPDSRRFSALRVAVFVRPTITFAPSSPCDDFDASHWLQRLVVLRPALEQLFESPLSPLTSPCAQIIEKGDCGACCHCGVPVCVSVSRCVVCLCMCMQLRPWLAQSLVAVFDAIDRYVHDEARQAKCVLHVMGDGPEASRTL